jgi:hypothetical protein
MTDKRAQRKHLPKLAREDPIPEAEVPACCFSLLDAEAGSSPDYEKPGPKPSGCLLGGTQLSPVDL